MIVRESSANTGYAETVRSHIAERVYEQKYYGVSLSAVAEVAAMTYQVPIALLTLVGKTHQYFKAAVGTGPEPTPVELTFCRHTVQSDEVLVVPDAQADPRFRENPFVTGDPHIRFYAGAPLKVGGVRVGSLCILDVQPRTLTAREAENLAYSAYTASSILEYQQPASRGPFQLLNFEQWRTARLRSARQAALP